MEGAYEDQKKYFHGSVHWCRITVMQLPENTGHCEAKCLKISENTKREKSKTAVCIR